MNELLKNIIDLGEHPIQDEKFRASCKHKLDQNGALVLLNFIKPEAIAAIQAEGEQCQHLAYYTANTHNIYLTPSDPQYTRDHPRNREVSSSKGCITTDQIPDNSVLHTLYNSPDLRDFFCAILDEVNLYAYNDPLSSINLHYADEGQELGWHYDNSSFAITLLIQTAESGGKFEYVKDVRDADRGEMQYELSGDILAGKIPTKSLPIETGTLSLFRGRNSMHRVTPVKGKRTRMLVVLAFNTEPGIALSESARMTFYGRLE